LAVTKPVNFICEGVFNHHEFVQLLEQVGSNYGAIIFYDNLRWFTKGSVFLNEIT